MNLRSSDIYLIDASIYIFQSHFSPYVECHDSEGNELSALYGFTTFLLQFLRRTRPRYAGVAMDESLFCGFRHQMCPDYKSNRELPDENLEMQLNACAEVCEVLGLSAHSSRKYEADDIIGTLAEQVCSDVADDAELVIVSRDKDLAQLIRDDSHYLWDYSGNKKRYRKHILDDYGIHPEQFPDYLGLIGDGVDCISGVPGVGPVKARALLANFHDMSGVYENLHKVPELELRGAKRLAELLEQHRDLAELSKELATIVCDAHCNPEDEEETFVGIGAEDLEIKNPSVKDLQALLRRYSFVDEDQERILSQLRSLMQSD
jgi:DNA polymerase I